MRFFCMGLNHKTAPVEVRERFAVPEHNQAEELAALKQIPSVNEGVVLSTCNRMELYFSVDDESKAELEIWEHVQAHFQVPAGAKSHFYSYSGAQAAKHLCSVASGLDSMVVGETEIFGQVKKAYQLAHQNGATAGMLNKLFQQVFSIGKKVRSSTLISQGTTSVGSAAVDLAEKIFGNLKQCKVLILGAGKMSRITAQSLQLRGAKSIFVANRSHDRAVELASQMGGEAVKFENWTDRLVDSDIVIASTAAPHAVVEKSHIEAVRARRKYRALFLIDIAVPRDIDPKVGDIEEVYLYDIDTLVQLAEDGKQRRQRQIEACERIIDLELEKRQIPGI